MPAIFGRAKSDGRQRFPHGDPSATWNVGTVKMIKEMEGMAEADKEKILGGNAMRLFGM